VAIQPAQMTVAQLEEGTWGAYRAFYGRRPRARRFARHLRTGMPAIFTGALLANNWAYARHYRSSTTTAPPFEPDPDDLRQLLVTSAVPAQEALGQAFRQAVSIGAPTRRVPS